MQFALLLGSHRVQIDSGAVLLINPGNGIWQYARVYRRLNITNVQAPPRRLRQAAAVISETRMVLQKRRDLIQKFSSRFGQPHAFFLTMKQRDA